MQRSLYFIYIFLILSIASRGQSQSYTIKGMVTPNGVQSKGVLTGATVNVKQLSKGASAALDGIYVIKNIPAGTYTLRCSFVGYKYRDTTITVNGNKVVDFHLDEQNSDLNAVQIAGRRNAESEASSKKSEQLSANIMNIISAKAIQLSPDITVANVLQRVSGVSVERSGGGEGRYAIIRGMDQRYNYTLINGIKIPSPDNKSRYVPLDIFPAELVERIEVSKTLTPDKEGDAIGGSVNMVMKNAPDRPYINGSLSTGYNQNLLERGHDAFSVNAINKKSPYELNGPSYLATPTDFTRDNLKYTHKNFRPNAMASLSAGDRFFDNRLGVMLSASYQNTYRTYQNVFSPAEFQDGGLLYLKHAYVRDYSTQVTRTGLNAKADYRINEHNKISLYNFYAILDEAQTRMTTDTVLPARRTGPGTGQIIYSGRSRFQRQTIYNSTLQGEHALLPEHLNFSWSGVYSKATSKIPDWAEYTYDGGFYADAATPNAAPYTRPNITQEFNRAWWANHDRDLSGYGDLAFNDKVKSVPYTFTVGGMYRDKHRDNFYQNYTLRPEPNSDGTPQLWSGIDNFKWSVYNPAGSPGEANNYRSNEKITAGYAMLKFQLKKLETIVGMRIENTNQDFNTDVPVTLGAKTGKISYSDKLPSVHFKYLLNDKTNLRLSYYGAVSRPGFFEIVPYSFQGENWTEKGNPNLLHTTSDNLDLRYELFPKVNEQLLIGAFYKRLYNPIEYGFQFTGVQSQTVYQPNNFGDATNYGFEMVFEKYIRMLGLRVNYTYTNSSITTSKFSSTLTNGGSAETVYIDEKRPLQGQSAHIANAAILYKNTGIGLDMQLTWQYTGKRIVLVAPYYGFDYWQKATNTFDFSAEKKFATHFSAFAKVQNILNARYEVYVNKPAINAALAPYQNAALGKTLTERSLYGQNYQLGLRYIL
ncbi:outer membrane receptor protein involved in Fe transport [Pedobacter sp. UYP24]